MIFTTPILAVAHFRITWQFFRRDYKTFIDGNVPLLYDINYVDIVCVYPALYSFD